MTDITPDVDALPSSDPGPLVDLRALYDDVDAAVARLAPVCELSGRCCRFREYGHTLFVSTIEAQFLLTNAPPPPRALDHGESCPWQDSTNRCVARDARPLGCRIYYCDPAYDRGPELSERFLSQLKQLADRHGLAWNYAPLHQHLHEARERGVFPIDLASDPA